MDDVFWIESNPPVGLAVVLCPREGESLKDELAAITSRSGVETLVSLLDPNEALWLGLKDEGPLAEDAGMQLSLLPDSRCPCAGQRRNVPRFRCGLADRLRAGERIGVHCRGSIGRATVTAACTLIHLGWKAKDALKAIQAARGCEVPDTAEQLRWILNYKAQP